MNEVSDDEEQETREDLGSVVFEEGKGIRIDVKGTPISIEPIREEPDEPYDPEGEVEETFAERSCKPVYKVTKGKRFKVILKLRTAPDDPDAGIQVAFWDATGSKVLDPVFKKYDPRTPLVIVTDPIVANAPKGDMICAARMAVEDDSPAGYYLAGEKRRVRVCIIKIVPPR